MESSHFTMNLNHIGWNSEKDRLEIQFKLGNDIGDSIYWDREQLATTDGKTLEKWFKERWELNKERQEEYINKTLTEK